MNTKEFVARGTQNILKLRKMSVQDFWDRWPQAHHIWHDGAVHLALPKPNKWSSEKYLSALREAGYV